MRSLGPLLVAVVGACSLAVSRPDQDNYEIDTTGVGGQALAQRLADRMNVRVETTDLTFPDSDRAEMYELTGDGFTIDLVPLPDDRCNTKASRHSTYKDQRFRADLVFTDPSPAAKGRSRHWLLSHVRDMQLPIAALQDCPLVKRAAENG